MEEKVKKKRVFTEAQLQAKKAYAKRYNSNPEVNKRNCIKAKEKRATLTIEQKRERLILKGKPILPRYMSEAELIVHKAAERARRNDAHRKRMENPEHRAAKRAKDRLRMENKDVRDRKRAIDRERAKKEGYSEKMVAAAKKYRGTEKFKEWAKKRAVINLVRDRVGKIPLSIGKVCHIISVRCNSCGMLSTKKYRLVGHSIVKSTYCSACAKGKRIPRTVDIVCVDCGDVCQGARNRRVCEPCGKKRAAVRKRTHPSEIARKREQGCSLRSRARKHGAYMDTVNVRKVYERDNWKCVGCGIKIVRSRYWQPNQATIDHRIPLSMGGSHTYENCQAMCMVCNSKKEALMPIGVQLSVFDRVG